MATQLEDIDQTQAITLVPERHDLDHPLTDIVDSLDCIVIDGPDVARFIRWAATVTWRPVFEAGIHSTSEDVVHRPLISTHIPLYTFRYEFCGGGRQAQDDETAALMDHLRARTRSWREYQVDLVGIDGYLLPIDAFRKPLDAGCGARLSPVSVSRVMDILNGNANDAPMGSKKWTRLAIRECPSDMSYDQVVDRIMRLAGGSMEQSEVRAAVKSYRSNGA